MAREYECYICKVQIRNKLSNLRRHMNLHSGLVPCFVCLGCNKQYQTKGNLTKHWGQQHDGDPIFVEAKRIAIRK